MKTYWIFLICLIFSRSLSAEPLKLEVHAEAAILMNADTGAILYEKKPRKRMYPASITKIATAMYALKVKGSSLEEIVTVDREAVAMTTEDAKIRSNYTMPAYWLVSDGVHLGFEEGEKISLKDLLYGMMMKSGNDAANIIAFHVAGSIPKFMTDLNKYLKQIGCKNTTFVNPHGLFHPQHQTTAYDMAVMSAVAIKNPIFGKIVSSIRHPRPKTNLKEEGLFIQTNKLIKPGKFYYDKAFGIKTGYLIKAGHTFVGAARKGERTLIAVLLKSKERNHLFMDAIKMFEAAFNETEQKRLLLPRGAQNFELVVEGATKPIQTVIHEDVILSYYPSEEPQIKCLLYWEDITLPVKKDQLVGYLKIETKGGRELFKVPLFAAEETHATWWHWLKNLF